MTARLLSGAVFGLIVLLAGIAGFRLEPDTGRYASGELLPNALLAGLLGQLGGMPLVILASAIAAGACIALLPDMRSRLLFLPLGGFWLLFPGADALGLLAVALLLRSRRRVFLAAAAAAHFVAALCVWPLARGWERPWLYAAVMALGVMGVFVALEPDWGPGAGIGTAEHVAYMTRYLLPAGFLYVATRRTAQ